MTLQEAIAKLMRSKKSEEKQEAAKEGAEEISKRLPAAVMPREAVEKKRKQLKDLDEATKE